MVEGFNEIASKFELIAAVEKHHKNRYLKLLENIQNNNVFKKDKEHEWICRKCGYVHYGKEAPKTFPICRNLQAYFKVRSLNY